MYLTPPVRWEGSPWSYVTAVGLEKKTKSTTSLMPYHAGGLNSLTIRLDTIGCHNVTDGQTDEVVKYYRVPLAMRAR